MLFDLDVHQMYEGCDHTPQLLNSGTTHSVRPCKRCITVDGKPRNLLMIFSFPFIAVLLQLRGQQPLWQRHYVNHVFDLTPSAINLH